VNWKKVHLRSETRLLSGGEAVGGTPGGRIMGFIGPLSHSKYGRKFRTRKRRSQECQESDPSLPLVIAIGHSLHRHEGTSNRVPVLLRRDTTWDEVNKVYEHELEGRHMLPADLIRECNLDSRNSDESDCAPAEITPKIKSFSLNWIRVSKLHARGTFQHVPAAEVHGMLQITVPYVLFRGPHHGSELAKVLTEEFIASVM
jgi:hypothetical protein